MSSSNGNGITAPNTARRLPGVPFSSGSDARRGHGVKGRSGRKPDWLRKYCDDLLASAKTKAAVRKILEDENHPAFAAMWKAVGERGHGKPSQQIAHSGDIAIRVVRQERKLIDND